MGSSLESQVELTEIYVIMVKGTPFDVSIAKPSWQPRATASNPNPFGTGAMTHAWEMYPRKGMTIGSWFSSNWAYHRNVQSIKGRTIGNLSLIISGITAFYVYRISTAIPDKHAAEHAKAERRAIINAPKLW